MKKNSPPLVSVIVRTHNRAKLLKISLESLINQTYHPLEIIVVDHNSTDNTRETVFSFNNKIRYIKHTGNYRDTFNVWRSHVRGKFISVLDDDDYVKPDCIEKLAGVLIKNESIDVSFSRHRFFCVYNDRCTIEKETKKIDSDSINKLLIKGNPIPWNAALFRTRCLKEIPEFDESNTGSFDWFFWIQMASAGYKFYQLDEVLGYIRRSPDSVQLEIERMIKGDLECIRYYGGKLKTWERISFGYYPQYGYRLICYGIICLEKDNIHSGRIILLKGMLFYFLGIRKRTWLAPALLIWISSLISNPVKSRKKIEKIFGIHLFRNYHQNIILKAD